MHTKAYRQQTWTILLLFVGHCFCAVSITQSNTNTDKGNSLNLTATTEEAGVTWTYDGGVHLTACLISQQLCFPISKDNMKFTADNSTNTSTIAIQSLNCSLNSETYVATTTLDTASVTIKVTTPISSISSTTNLTTAKVSSQELSVEVDCVNLKNSISANYSVSRSGKPVDILIPDSIQPITFDAACNCIEKTHVITKIITALQYPNEVVEVQANVGRLALSIGKVNFTAGTDTTMEITTTSTSDESTTSQNPSTSILGLRTAETSGQSTDSCDSSYWNCIRVVLPVVFIASVISTILLVVWWTIKGESFICWLAEYIFCCCAQKIKSCCEKWKYKNICGIPAPLLLDVFVIDLLIWLCSIIVIISICCTCKESQRTCQAAGIFLSLIVIALGTAIVLIVWLRLIYLFCKTKLNGDPELHPNHIKKEAGDNVNILEQRAHDFKKIKSIDLTKDGEKVSSDKYEVVMTTCPSLTLKMVSLDQSGKYECTISYDLTKKEVHQLNLLVTPKQYEIKMGDKKKISKFLNSLKIVEDVTWTHNDDTIPGDSCFYKGGTKSNPSLTVKYCTTSDSGLYVCNIRTNQGSKRFSARLKIKETDAIKVDVGGKITLLENLISNNTDFEDVKWYHKKQPIPHNDFSYEAEQQNRSALTINLVTANMEGQYKCVVRSTKGAHIKVFNVQVNVIDNYTVDSGKKIHLLKDLSSYHGIKQISWELNGKPLTLAENPSNIGGTKDHPVLTVNCATKEDAGKYTCILEFESQPTKELKFKLDVNELWHVDSGESIVLLDNLEKSINVTSVEWTYKKMQVSCIHKGGTIACPALTIPVVSPEDSGEYECKLTLEQGKIIVCHFDLKVNVQKIKKHVGEKVILLQNLTSAGTIQGINWYKNGRKVPASSDSKYQGGVNKSPGLLVGSLRQDDSGRYECDIITESQIKLHIPVDLTVEQKENSTWLGPIIRNNRVHNLTENIQS